MKWRRHIFMMPVWLLFSSLALGQISYYLPQVANGGGFKTTFIFFNNGNTPSALTLTFRDDDGELFSMNIPGLGEGDTLNFTLKAGETRFYQSDGVGQIKVGSARVHATGPVGVSAVFSMFSGGNLVTEAGVGASGAVTEVVLPVDTKNGFHTGVAISPPVLGGDFTFTLYDSDGTVLDTTQKNIPALGHFAQFVDGELFGEAGIDMRGKMVIQGPAAFSAVALRQKGSLLTTFPVVPSVSALTEFALPQVANGTAALLGYKTQIVVFNLRSTTGQATVIFTNDSGDPLNVKLTDGSSGHTFKRDIPGHGTVFLETDASGSLSVGAARVTSDVPIGVTAIFSEMHNGTVATEAGVGNSEGYTEITLPFDQSGGFGTGVALFNLGKSGATVAYKVLDENGEEQLVAGKRVSDNLPPYGHVAKFVNQIVEGVSGRGQLLVTSEQPLAAVVIRQGSGILTTLPVSEGVTDTGGGGTGTELLPTAVENVNLQSDTILNQTLNTGVKLSGQVAFPPGYFQTGAVQAIDSVGNVFSGFANPITGGYSIIVPPGTYDLRVCAVTSDDIPTIPFDAGSSPQFTFNSGMFLTHREGQVSVPSDTTHDIVVEDVEVETIAGKVDNLEEIGSEGTGLGIFVTLSSEESRTQGLAMIGEDGSYETTVAAGEYTASIYFGEGVDENQDGIPDEFTSSASLYNIDTVAVSTSEAMDITANLTVPDLVNLTGNVTQVGVPTLPDESTALAIDATFSAESFLVQCYPQFGASFSPVESGEYAMKIISGRNYDVAASVPVTEIGKEDEGSMISPLFGSNTRSYTDSQSTQDIQLPAIPDTVTLSGKVTGPDGNPVEGVMVSATTVGGVNSAGNAMFSAGTVTDAQGNYSLTVLKGISYRIDFDPPIDFMSGFPF